MNFTRENARNVLGAAESKLISVFGDQVTGAYAASFQSVDGKTVVGACNLPYAAPVAVTMMNTADVACYLEDFADKNSLFVFGDTIRHVTDDGEAEIPENIRASLAAIYTEVCSGAGTLAENGDHIIDLKAGKIGTHFDVNLLIGNRLGFPSPLLTTPKGALDSLGRGSFRSTAARQVTSTRYTLTPEQNGEPCNRQFYLVENGAQIFYSADVHTNVKSAFCRHSHNYSEITYETECGLKIVRTIFILPQEEGMPEAVEAQHVTVENLADKPRKLKIVFTGMFGLATPESIMSDTVYASVTWESSVLCLNGKPAVVCPSPFPQYLKPLKRFAVVLANGETSFIYKGL
ncbi:MAG: hypothetical protein IKM00_01375 [Clostridia bacterium]|nr:hypothetical protein [Clostridia bacterium]